MLVTIVSKLLIISGYTFGPLFTNGWFRGNNFMLTEKSYIIVKNLINPDREATYRDLTWNFHSEVNHTVFTWDFDSEATQRVFTWDFNSRISISIKSDIKSINI